MKEYVIFKKYKNDSILYHSNIHQFVSITLNEFHTHQAVDIRDLQYENQDHDSQEPGSYRIYQTWLSTYSPWCLRGPVFTDYPPEVAIA